MPSRKTLLRILTAAMVVVMLASVAVIAATAGTDSDPLVTRSYLEGPYKKTLLSEAESAAESQVETLERSLDKRIQSFTSNLSDTVPDRQTAESAYETQTLAAGESLTLPAGTQMLFLSGAATMAGAGLTGATAGTALATGAALTANHSYVASGDCTPQAGAETKILMK